MLTRRIKSCTSGRRTNSSVYSPRLARREMTAAAIANSMLNLPSSPVCGVWLRRISECVWLIDTVILAISAGFSGRFASSSSIPSSARWVQ